MLNVDLGIAAGSNQPRCIVSALASCWALLALPLSGTSPPSPPSTPTANGYYPSRARMRVTLPASVEWREEYFPAINCFPRSLLFLLHRYFDNEWALFLKPSIVVTVPLFFSPRLWLRYDRSSPFLHPDRCLYLQDNLPGTCACIIKRYCRQKVYNVAYGTHNGCIK